MDNLTHSLVGALLGQMGLKRRSGLAMPTLIIAANIPDIDAACTVYGMQSLAMRRGITHGPIAMLLLPLALTAIMFAWDRRQARRGTRPEDRLPVRPGWLLALAFIGCLSHPFFDWLNSYGVRLLEPFSNRWFYGDALFIIDPWLWAMLIAGVWISRRREKAGRSDWRRPAVVGFAGVAGYIALNLHISANAVERQANNLSTTMIVANPVPLLFWERHMLMRNNRSYWIYGRSVSQTGHDVMLSRPTGITDPRIAVRVARNPDAQAFLFWSRMPIAEVDGDTIILRDQRFLNSLTASNFTVELKP